MTKAVNRLVAKAKKQTVAVKKAYGKSDEVLIKGVAVDPTAKHNIEHQSSARTVGMNFGVTLNMDNFESARIDCWITDVVQEGETFEQALSRVQEIVVHRVEEISAEYKDVD